MTAMAYGTASPATRTSRSPAWARLASVARIVVGSLRESVASLASTAQLGTDRETEIGRLTGARI